MCKDKQELLAVFLFGSFRLRLASMIMCLMPVGSDLLCIKYRLSATE